MLHFTIIYDNPDEEEVEFTIGESAADVAVYAMKRAAQFFPSCKDIVVGLTDYFFPKEGVA